MSIKKLFLFSALFGLFFVGLDFSVPTEPALHQTSKSQIKNLKLNLLFLPQAIAEVSNCDGISFNQNLDTESINSEIKKLDEQIGVYLKKEGDGSCDPTCISKRKACQEIREAYQDQLSQLTSCNQAKTQMEEQKVEFSRACAGFTRRGNSIMKCNEAIETCNQCPDTEDPEDSDLDCVTIHSRTECPVKLGSELETAKEERDKLDEEVESATEAVSEQEKDIVQKQNDLTKELSELENDFSDTIKEMERTVQEEREDLEQQLSDKQSDISKTLSEALANTQSEIDQSIEVIHGFEKAITESNTIYRREVRQITMDCEIQAQKRLTNYRLRRRAAIQTGSLRISLASLLRRGRTSFASKDRSLLKRYRQECLRNRRSDFKEAKINYLTNLQTIEKRKLQYQQKMQGVQQQINGLNQTAGRQKSQAVQEYAQNVGTAHLKHQKEFARADENYQKNKRTVMSRSNAVVLGQKQLFEKRHSLREVTMSSLRTKGLVSLLKDKGVTKDSEEKFTNAITAYPDYEGYIINAIEACKCSDKDPNTSPCSEIIKNGVDINLASAVEIKGDSEEDSSTEQEGSTTSPATGSTGTTTPRQRPQNTWHPVQGNQ